MPHTLRSLTLIVLLCSSAGLPSSGRSDEPAGNRAVAAAARSVHAESALSADLRTRIDAFGHELVGQGTYHQLGKGPEKLLKLELKIQIADQAVVRQEICGPAYYYIRRQSPLAPPSLGRVNLRALRLAIARAPDAMAADPSEHWILLGGLPKLLESLHQNFDFTQPRPDELQFQVEGSTKVERVPVFVVRGAWNPERLAVLRQTDKGKSKDAAEQLPDEVELVLGRDDQPLPLFPYRITYLRIAGEGQGGAGQGGAGEPLRPMLTLELFNVHRKGDLDPRQFDYQPGDQDVAELTHTYLQRLGLAKPGK
jgi:hypothetical protein